MLKAECPKGLLTLLMSSYSRLTEAYTNQQHYQSELSKIEKQQFELVSELHQIDQNIKRTEKLQLRIDGELKKIESQEKVGSSRKKQATLEENVQRLEAEHKLFTELFDLRDKLKQTRQMHKEFSKTQEARQQEYKQLTTARVRLNEKLSLTLTHIQMEEKRFEEFLASELSPSSVELADKIKELLKTPCLEGLAKKLQHQQLLRHRNVAKHPIQRTFEQGAVPTEPTQENIRPTLGMFTAAKLAERLEETDSVIIGDDSILFVR